MATREEVFDDLALKIEYEFPEEMSDENRQVFSEGYEVGFGRLWAHLEKANAIDRTKLIEYVRQNGAPEREGF